MSLTIDLEASHSNYLGNAESDPSGRQFATKSRMRLVGSQPVPDPPSATLPVDLEIVIPVLNEELRLGATVAEIAAHLADANFSARIIVVDNGCTDYTAEIIDQAPGGIEIELISCRERGKGAAVRAGVLHSTAPFVAYCDADLSTPPSALLQAFDLLQDGWLAVIGSRRCAGASYELEQSVVRRLGSRAFNLAAGGMVGNMSDTQCGFKMLEGDLARRIFGDMQLAGFAFDVELIGRLLSDGASMTELPIHWVNDDASTFNLVSDGVRAFRDLYQVRRVLQNSPVASCA